MTNLTINLKKPLTAIFFSLTASGNAITTAQNLKKINSAYSDYKKTLARAETGYAAGKFDKQELRILKAYNAKYIAAISLATATLAGKTARIADTIEAVGESTIAGGFNIDIRADLDLLISQSERLQTITKPSNITAGQDITIESGSDTQITGGKITAGKNIDITSANLNITAAADAAARRTEEKQALIPE
ncbi:MAG: hemagglutinin repeat-containing protein [Deltaproteobacteria bacterium]|nr:hemagglutinin repeat-containing protein [Deltaproteobacteria bacterium]